MGIRLNIRRCTVWVLCIYLVGIVLVEGKGPPPALTAFSTDAEMFNFYFMQYIFNWFVLHYKA
jgi:hypothetical protein